MNVAPAVFQQLLSHENISEQEMVHTQDGFGMIGKSLAEILARKNIFEFVESVNQMARRIVCNHEKIYIQNADKLTAHERDVILSTHTGNTSRYSFAAEVEYHARYLTSWARIKPPFFKKSIYDSAVRADMTIGDADRGLFVPYYRENSRIVKKQYQLHK